MSPMEILELALKHGLPFALAGGGAWLFWREYQRTLKKYHDLIEGMLKDVRDHDPNKDSTSD